MSKKEKLLRKLCAVPIPRDFTWEDLVTLMTRAGFAHECDGGSHFVFEHTSGLRFTMSRTHPSGILKLYQVSAAKTALRAVDELGDE